MVTRETTCTALAGGYLTDRTGANSTPLAVPGDLAGGRYVSRITRIWVGPAERVIPL